MASPSVDRGSEATITVVGPAHGAERDLARALGSLEGQLRPLDEVVIVDDGSTDVTADVAERRDDDGSDLSDYLDGAAWTTGRGRTG